jgi:hypothetical protein
MTIGDEGSRRALRAAWLSLCLGAWAAGTAVAAPLVVSSYDMVNGDVSSLNTSLRDDSYTGGTGNPAVAYSTLAGGKGDLVDGLVASGNWNLTPGPFVGWRDQRLPSPTITFHFAAPVLVDEVRVHINKGYSPSSIDLTMGGTTRSHVVDMGIAGGANDWVTLSGIALAGDSLVMRLNDRPAEWIGPNYLSRDWILISEVAIDGSVAAVPEPATIPLLLMGLGTIAWVAQRRRR